MEVGLFGKKLGMTQIFDDQGSIIPVTLVEVKPCQVSQIKTIDSDSYNAIQIAYFEENLNRLTKPTLGHLKKSGDKGFKSFAEFRGNIRSVARDMEKSKEKFELLNLCDHIRDEVFPNHGYELRDDENNEFTIRKI